MALYVDAHVKIAITVVNGAGSGTFQKTGKIKRIIVKPPVSGGPYTYTPEITDDEDDPVWGSDPVSGTRAFLGLDEPVDITCTFHLTNVSGDGIFNVKIAVETGGRG